jgi:heme/copper-type cytochrome/quinol oxidase subunit 1
VTSKPNVVLRGWAALAAFLFVIGAILFALFAYAGLSAWIGMLLLGALHSVWPAIPALGFWVTFLVTFSITFFGGLLRGRK